MEKNWDIIDYIAFYSAIIGFVSFFFCSLFGPVFWIITGSCAVIFGLCYILKNPPHKFG